MTATMRHKMMAKGLAKLLVPLLGEVGAGVAGLVPVLD